MNLFATVKTAVTVKAAASFYGLNANRNNMVRCPFHPDKTPSMKLDSDHFYCFGCHEHGDVIDLTAKLFDLNPLDAARKLADDFNIRLDPDPIGAVLPIPTSTKKVYHDEIYCAGVMIDYENFLKKQIEVHAPKDPDENWDPRFCAACHSLPRVSATIDELFSADPEERRETAAWLIADGIITRIEDYLKNREDIYGKSA